MRSISHHCFNRYPAGMPDHLNWLLMHGWGFDASVWTEWSRRLPDTQNTYIPDRGYFHASSEFKPGLKNFGRHVAVTHSMGLHLIPDGWWNRITHLVIIGGFLSFHPSEKNRKRRSQKILANMLHKVESDPETVLDEFYINCFKPDRVPYSRPGPVFGSRLLEDLELLNTHKMATRYLKRLHKILILHGANDGIVDPGKAEELHELLPGSRLYIHDTQGHGLPFLQPGWCLQHVRKWLIENEE